MAEHIDHAAEAVKLLENYAPDYMVAQVHATLALVEQQRIANLLAVAQMEGGPHKDANGWTRTIKDENGYYVDDEDVNVYLRREIREGLGLS